jgi:diacylglycerol kinase (ATP)
VGSTAVIYNPQKVDKARLQIAVDRALSQSGERRATYLPTTDSSHGHLQAQSALEAGNTLIIVAGGDGTIRAVAEVLAYTDVSIGLIPLGTGNVLARNLGVPLGSLSRAALKAVRGVSHRIDLGRVTLERADGSSSSHSFAVMAGLGLDAKIIMNTDADLKRKLGWVAYVEGGLRSLPVRFERMDVSVNGHPVRRFKLHSLLIGNCGFLPGNINLMPDAQLDDGLLDIATVGPRRVWNWIDFWNRVTWVNFLRGRVVGASELADFTANVKTLGNLSGKSIEVNPLHEVDVQLDGDSFGQVIAARFDVLPQALSIRL